MTITVSQPFSLELVIQLLSGILHGNDSEFDHLYDLADSEKLSPDERKFLQLLSTLVVKTEATEYRLEMIVSDLLQTQAKLIDAELDPLTQIPNRAVFNDQLHLQLENARTKNECLGLIFIDLDKFKEVNDRLGHDAGDEILQQASQRMQKHLRKKDLLARLGGDEFTILLPGVGAYEQVEVIANRIRESLARSFNLQSGKAEIGSSIGISLYPQDCKDAPSLLKNADVAMYTAKENGRNLVVTYPDRHKIR